MSKVNGVKNEASGSTTLYSKEQNYKQRSPSSSAIPTFFKWFKKNEKRHKSITNANGVCSSNSSQYSGSHDTLSPPSSPFLGNISRSSSCDSVLSTSTTGFAFIKPQHYKPNKNSDELKIQLNNGIPETDTYRERIKKYNSNDKNPQISLREKYFLYDTDTLKSNDSHITETGYDNVRYYDRSLPSNAIRNKSPLSDINNSQILRNRRRHRRAVSDSSKDKKSGAYVHVKGKRKAPPPPPLNLVAATNLLRNHIKDHNNDAINKSPRLERISSPNELYSPTGSTLGRKKRRAPSPPQSPISLPQSPKSPPQSPKSPLYDKPKSILSDSLLNDKEIQAIIEGTRSIRNIVKNSSTINNSSSIVVNNMFSKRLSTKLDDSSNGDKIRRLSDDNPMSDSNDDKNDSNISPTTAAAAVTISPISPRPWYKRPISSNRDSSIPFKREVVLKTMEKRKHKVKEKEKVTTNEMNLLPEVGYSRSSIFDSSSGSSVGHKFGFFLRHKDSSSSSTPITQQSQASSSSQLDENRIKDKNKRRSGIGIPNISELDREAAEIVNKENANKIATEKAEQERFFNSYEQQHLLLQQEMFASKGQQREEQEREEQQQDQQQENELIEENSTQVAASTKDLISKFESTSNGTRITINTSFIGRTENFFQDKFCGREMKRNDDDDDKEKSVHQQQHQQQKEKQLGHNEIINKSTTKATTSTTTTTTTSKTPASEILQTSPSSSSSSISGVKETIQTSEKGKQSTGIEMTKTNNPNENVLKTIWTCPFCTLENPNWRIICEVCERLKPYDKPIRTNIETKPKIVKEIAKTDPLVNPPKINENLQKFQKNELENENTNLTNLSKLNQQHQQQPSDWEKKAERVMKYFMPRNSSNALSKSSSETAVIKKPPVFRKSPSPSKLPKCSPNLSRRRKSRESILEKRESNPVILEKILNLKENDKKQPLLDSSVIITTVTPIYYASSITANPTNLEEAPLKKEEEAPLNKEKEAAAAAAPATTKKAENLATQQNKQSEILDNQLEVNKKGINLKEVRNARLAKFSSPLPRSPSPPLSPKFKHPLSQIPGNRTLLKEGDLDSLEREKIRLREKIRAMNAKALAEKYPVLQQQKMEENTEMKPINSVNIKEENFDEINNKNIGKDDLNKHGAIKKIFPTNINHSERDGLQLLQKIQEETNPIYQNPSSNNKVTSKPKKISTSVQTPGFVKKLDDSKSSSREILSDDDSFSQKQQQQQQQYDKLHNITNLYDVIPMATDKDQMQFSDYDTAKVIQISEQLQSLEGISDFKATLRKGISKTDTIALNKIMRSLELAISEGKDELAAKIAMDLAKMKVSLQVTKAKNRPCSGTIDYNQSIIVDLYVEDKISQKGPIQITVKPLMTITELKQKALNDFDIPIELQKWLINDEPAIDNNKTLLEYGVHDCTSGFYLYLIIPEQKSQNHIIKNRKDFDFIIPKTSIAQPEDIDGNLSDGSSDSHNDIELNESLEGATALPLTKDTTITTTMMTMTTTTIAATTTSPNNNNNNLFDDIIINNDLNTWKCPLCTLINPNDVLACGACTKAKPIESNFALPRGQDKYVMSKELRQFLERNNIPIPIEYRLPERRNDLNKINPNRKSSEIFNIIEDNDNKKIEKPIPLQIEYVTIENTRKSLNFSSPNITRNKYRGVDNYNPNSKNGKEKITSIFDNKPIATGSTTGVTRVSTTGPTTGPTSPSTRVSTAGTGAGSTRVPISSAGVCTPGPAGIHTTSVGPSNVTKSIKREKPRAPQPPNQKVIEETNHYLELLKLDNSDIVLNQEPFECPVCFMKIHKDEGVILRECLHSFCKECLSNTIRYNEEAEIKCPYMDADYSCNSILQEREIKAIVSHTIYEQHLAKSIRVAEHQIENAFHCKTPNCRGWCIYEDNVNEFKCPVCKIINCLLCRVIHDGLTCKQYQDQLNNDCDSNLDARRTKEMLNEMVEKGEAMNCPTCQVIMMKKWGCDWLRCSMCKTEVCWVTRGPRWGPGGKGDTTGGCKCGVDGKKCHPKCNYCH